MKNVLWTRWQGAGTALLAAAIFLLGTTAPTRAFDGLTDAQAWIYDRSHLVNTSVGQLVEYSYTSTDGQAGAISDVATLSILQDGDDDKRDVEIDFLSDERHLALPPFSGYRGNPVIIAMLEHIAQSLGTETGGGALYFRNRIRDALASDKLKLVNTRTQYGDTELETMTLRFFPFENDEFLKGYPLFLNAEFLIEFSDDVPAGIVSVSVSAEHHEQSFNRQLTIR